MTEQQLTSITDAAVVDAVSFLLRMFLAIVTVLAFVFAFVVVVVMLTAKVMLAIAKQVVILVYKIQKTKVGVAI